MPQTQILASRNAAWVRRRGPSRPSAAGGRLFGKKARRCHESPGVRAAAGHQREVSLHRRRARVLLDADARLFTLEFSPFGEARRGGGGEEWAWDARPPQWDHRMWSKVGARGGVSHGAAPAQTRGVWVQEQKLGRFGATPQESADPLVQENRCAAAFPPRSRASEQPALNLRRGRAQRARAACGAPTSSTADGRRRPS
jgi:hypothetical protein